MRWVLYGAGAWLLGGTMVFAGLWAWLYREFHQR